MRRVICFSMCLCLLLACVGCGVVNSGTQTEMLQPVRFYYKSVAPDDSRPESALGWELRDLGAEILSVEEVLNLYLQGPESQELRSVLPAEISVERAYLLEGVLSLTLSNGLSALSGAERTLAVAGLVCTMEQFQDIDSVWITSEDGALTELFSHPLTKSDFLLFDDSATNDQVAVKLYYSDSNGRYLKQETRNRSFDSEDEIPAYVIQQLIAGPRDRGSLAALPEGTDLLQLKTEDGLCTVNFSSAFLENAPHVHGQARMTVFSVVNSLTELPQIEQVRILCNGMAIENYAGLNLMKPLVREEDAISQPSKGNTYDAVLYLVCDGGEKLVEVPKVIRRTTGRTLTEDLLTALQNYEGSNGYKSPVPQGAVAVDVKQRGSTCQVTYNSAFAMCNDNPQKAQQAVRSIVATLCAQDGVDQVELKIYNEALTCVDLSNPISPEKDWFIS